MPHLIVVIDEIRDLKVEYPRELQKICEIALRANILGIHLIYSTSKVHGLVDATLDNLVDFRLCSEH